MDTKDRQMNTGWQMQKLRSLRINVEPNQAKVDGNGVGRGHNNNDVLNNVMPERTMNRKTPANIPSIEFMAAMSAAGPLHVMHLKLCSSGWDLLRCAAAVSGLGASPFVFLHLPLRRRDKGASR